MTDRVEGNFDPEYYPDMSVTKQPMFPSHMPGTLVHSHFIISTRNHLAFFLALACPGFDYNRMYFRQRRQTDVTERSPVPPGCRSGRCCAV